jgi:hypothetical protein
MSGLFSRRVPLSFILARHRLTWAEAARGYAEQWMIDEDVVALAAERVARGGATADEEAMAEVAAGDRSGLREIFERLVAGEAWVEREVLYRTWMRLLLAWAYENRQAYEDPLGIVEDYADFDILRRSRLVRYMPLTRRARGPRRRARSSG